MPPKADWEKYRAPAEENEENKAEIVPLSEGDIAVLKSYGAAPYGASLKQIEKDIKDIQTRINEKIGIKESDTGLAPPHQWDLAADKQNMSQEQPLQVARCTKIIPAEDETKKTKYVINVKQIAKFGKCAIDYL